VHSISINRRLCARGIAAFVCSLLGGCYLLQSAAGQLQVLSRRKPISRVIANPGTPAEVKSQLEAVAQIREFASRRLGLPDNGSYRSYADLRRPYVVWNVVAAPEFSVEPKEWCYPIVGCVAYRGYFVERRARRFADELRRRGLDVTVDGVAAYSTLGHFDDPILNTMLGWSDVELASIIFHELTHQMIYVPNDADFNEALAVTVEEEGVRRWLKSLGREQELERQRQYEERFAQVLHLLTRARDRLRTLYASGVDHTEMRREKSAVYAALRNSYSDLRLEWGDHGPFDSWLDGELNNARLASIATYYDCVPGFRRELEAVGGNLSAFYARVRELAKLDQKQRDSLLCGSPEPALP
jgi:predicted aminopeptidase